MMGGRRVSERKTNKYTIKIVWQMTSKVSDIMLIYNASKIGE